MEMSVGTIVTIVLLMSVLVLGLVLLKNIFGGANNSITSVNTQLNSKINQLFSDGKASRVAVLPDSRRITIKRGASPPSGFAFSIYNDAKKGEAFNYTVTASDVSNCDGQLTTDEANSYMIGGKTSTLINLGGGRALENARIVTFSVPKSAPPCTIVYTLNIYEGTQPYDNVDVQVTYK